MIVVIGAGLIGLAIAFELARRGASVRVVDAGEPAAAASWAGAGMLAPYSEELTQVDPALAVLGARSLALYPAFVDEVRAASGVDPRLRLDGLLVAACNDGEGRRLHARAAQLAGDGIAARYLERREAVSLEPSLGPSVRGALLCESEGQVDNRRLGRALRAACEARGVRIDAHAGRVALEADARRVLGVRSELGFIPAQTVVNAAGAWAGELAGVPEAARISVEPVKGQMLALAIPRGFMRRVVWAPGAYLVPRDDGRLLIGATVERAGEDVRVTAGGLRSLLDAALAALPALADFALVESWAGLRPGTRDGLPWLGPTAISGYFVAAGHFRNGILLAPATARALADAIEGRASDFSLAAFAPSRAQEPPPASAKESA
ncbi:MAG: glycine oxidase ThiO [Vulcanimicrobiaceae bacterium]